MDALNPHSLPLFLPKSPQGAAAADSLAGSWNSAGADCRVSGFLLLHIGPLNGKVLIRADFNWAYCTTVFLGVVRGKRHLRLFFQTVTNPGGQICSYEEVQVLMEANVGLTESCGFGTHDCGTISPRTAACTF